jgi:hypothetical protein
MTNGLSKIKEDNLKRNNIMMVLLIFTILILGLLIYFAIDRVAIELKYMNTLKERELEQFKKK